MAATLEQGSLFSGRFEIDRQVAGGGMGTIYSARDRVSGDRVALKLLGEAGTQGYQSGRFLREARILSELHHPGIVSYVAHGQSVDGQPFLVMQWLDGEDLSQRLRRGPLPLCDSLVVMERVASALAVAHERGIVHRDLKPSNLFLRDGRPGQVVLLDFGVARDVDTLGTLTGTGLLIGTPSYMAPEQARSSREITPAADIFSLGCVLYECLTAAPPFQAGHVVAVLARILFDEPAPVRSICPALPEVWELLLSRMLHKDPERRPRDASALAVELSMLPPVLPEHETRAEQGPVPVEAAWASTEQELVSVVLASPNDPATDDLQRDASAGDGASQTHISTIQSALSHFGAQVERLADGSVLVTVVLKSSAKDQVGIAVRAALVVRRHLPGARIAVVTGRSVRRRRVAMGEVVDRAVKLLGSSQESQPSTMSVEGIRLDDVTANLLDPRFVLSKTGEEVILEGEGMTADESRPLLGKPTPCVGRERELVQLEGALTQCVEDSEAQSVLVVAPAGIGKSRLRHEFLRRRNAKETALQILIGYADPLSAGSPYGMLNQALRRHAQIQHGDDPARQRAALEEKLCCHVPAAGRRWVAEFLGELCGVAFLADSSPPLQAARSDPKAMSEHIERAFLDWLQAECAVQPVLIVLEDLHWGDALTIKLIDAVLSRLAHQPLFVLMLARPEIAERFPKFWERCLHILMLRPLSQKASERLVQEVLGERQITRAMITRMVELSAGNALFLEELIRTVAEGKMDEVPETVLAVLEARLQRLDPETRRVLRAASVFGATFWASGVQFLCDHGEAVLDAASCFPILVHVEIIEEHRTSRFPQETEYGFRHALVRDAAYSLLTDADRALGHRLACQYLDHKGETDAMVLAGHAERGGDIEKAIALYCRAAEQSLERDDLEQTLASTGKSVACGAQNELLGTLRALESLAHMGLGQFAQAAETGTEAVALLPRGSLWWYKAAENLFNVYPMFDQKDRFEQLVQDFEQSEPAPAALAAYVSADAFQMMMFAIGGVRDRARRCLERIRRFGTSVLEHNVRVRGYFHGHYGWLIHTLYPDPYLALSLAKDSVRDSMQTQLPRHLWLSQMLLGVTQAALGDLAEAEKSLRSSLKNAREARDPFAISVVHSYACLTPLDSADPSRLDEIENLAHLVCEANVHAGLIAMARAALASVGVARGRLPQAEADARRSLELFAGTLVPYSFVGRSALMNVLQGQDRPEEAVTVARKGLALLAELGGTGWSEVPFRVAVVETLHAAGKHDEARGALREALRQIEIRAEKIPDPVWKQRYLTQRPDNLRAFELARSWFGEPGAEPRDTNGNATTGA